MREDAGNIATERRRDTDLVTVTEGQQAGQASDLSLAPAFLTEQRRSDRDRWTPHALRAADLLGLGLAAGLALLVLGGSGALATLALLTVLALSLIQTFSLYARDRIVMRASTLDELPRLTQAITFAAALTVLVGPSLADTDRTLTTATWALACLSVPGIRKVARATVNHHTATQHVLILGSGMIADLVAAKLSLHHGHDHELIGCLDVEHDDVCGSDAVPLLGTLSDLDAVVADRGVDHVVIAFSAGTDPEELIDAIRHCRRLGLKVSAVPRLFEVMGSHVEFHDVGGMTMLGLRGPARSRGALAAKRTMDVVGSLAALVLLSPLLALIAVAIRLTSAGPTLYSQERIGRDQQPFRMLKFRTMVVDADAHKADIAHLNEFSGGTMFKIALDPRVTPVGRFLRRTSLDEFPQFVNVLRGEMSIVGPRPLIREENDAVLGWYRTRLDITPGLTGPWQVLGRQHVPFDEMVKMDCLYVAEWSLWRDLKLTLRTIPVMLRRTGA